MNDQTAKADAGKLQIHLVPVKSRINTDMQWAREALEAKSMRWIPINEQLPEEHKVYLVTYVTKTGKRYVRSCECSYAGTSPRCVYWSKKISGEVVAWMPLPEPYTGD